MNGMSNPRVSVIIPTFNRVRLVVQAIDSVLAQSYVDFEIIVVDDGSQDETRSTVNAYSDPRIRYIYQSNLGPSGARNTGLAHARGQYIAFLDADDVFLAESIATRIQELERQPELGLVAGGLLYVDKSGNPLAERRPWLYQPQLSLSTWLFGCPITPSAAMVKREWLDRVSGFDTTLHGGEDRDLWLRLAQLGCQMAWTPQLVCTYRIHESQLVQGGKSHMDPTLTVLDKFFSQSGLPADIRQQHDHAYASVYLEGAFREYGAGQIDAARQSLDQAVRLQPALAKGEPPMLADVLISWAVNPVTGDPSNYVNRVLDNLPDSAKGVIPFARRVALSAAVRTAVDAKQAGNGRLALRHLTTAQQVNPELFDEPADVIELLVDYVSDQPTEKQSKYVDDFFEDLPPALEKLKPLRRKAHGRLCMAKAFQSHDRGDARGVAATILRGISLDRRWLRHRGVWSVLLWSMRGSRFSTPEQARVESA